MRWITRFAYAVGHVLNDITCAVWFTYTLIYFQTGLDMPSSLVGAIMLVGQFSDAIATPVVGFYSDIGIQMTQVKHDFGLWYKLTAWFPKGRLAWHFYGSLLVILSFPFIFSPPYGGVNSDNFAMLIYYISLVVIFQIGWAAVQISHLALMNDLTEDTGERILLTSMRYFFTVFGNLIVFIVAYFILRHQPKSQDRIFANVYNSTIFISDRNKVISRAPNDAYSELSDFDKKDFIIFRTLAYIIVFIGVIFTAIFHIFINSDNWYQKKLDITDNTSQTHLKLKLPINIKSPTPGRPHILKQMDWFKVPQFWITSFIYMTNRLIINISQVYISLYLLVSLLLPKLTLSLIPLTIFISSMLAAIVQKPFHKYLNRELACLFGMFFVSMFCSLVHYPGNPPSQVRVYAGAILLGVGWAFLLITSLAIVGDLVEGNTSTGAFVYGVTSFTDKMASGIIIQIIQALKPPTDKQLEKLYYKYTESYFIEGLLGFAALLLVIRFALRKIKSLPSREASLINDETCDT